MAEEQEEIDDEFSTAQHDLNSAAIDLLVNVGIISSLRPRWPLDIQANWVREIQKMREDLDDACRNVQEFASSLD